VGRILKKDMSAILRDFRVRVLSFKKQKIKQARAMAFIIIAVLLILNLSRKIKIYWLCLHPTSSVFQ
jgi:hypothetical protein